MKKYLLLAFLAATAIGMRAELNRLMFQTLAGEEQSVGLDGLNITFADGKLLASSQGESLTLDLATLASMEFVEGEPSGIADAAVEGAVEAYSADGICHGKFESKDAADSTLPGGLYIIKSESGITSKLLINR